MASRKPEALHLTCQCALRSFLCAVAADALPALGSLSLVEAGGAEALARLQFRSALAQAPTDARCNRFPRSFLQDERRTVLPRPPHVECGQVLAERLQEEQVADDLVKEIIADGLHALPQVLLARRHDPVVIVGRVGIRKTSRPKTALSRPRLSRQASNGRGMSRSLTLMPLRPPSRQQTMASRAHPSQTPSHHVSARLTVAHTPARVSAFPRCWAKRVSAATRGASPRVRPRR